MRVLWPDELGKVVRALARANSIAYAILFARAPPIVGGIATNGTGFACRTKALPNPILEIEYLGDLAFECENVKHCESQSGVSQNGIVNLNGKFAKMAA